MVGVDATYKTRYIIVSASKSRGNKKPSPAPKTDRSIDELTLGVFVLNSMAIEWELISSPVVADEESLGLISSVINLFGGEHPECGH